MPRRFGLQHYKRELGPKRDTPNEILPIATPTTLRYYRWMQTNRLEAFSDGVLAIIITIMVLELKVPHGADLAALEPELPVFASYVLSFIYVGIYWNNHHHLLHSTKHVSAGILWANSAPVVLALALSLLHGMDGPEPCSAHTLRGVWRRAADGRHRLLSPRVRHYRP